MSDDEFRQARPGDERDSCTKRLGEPGREADLTARGDGRLALGVDSAGKAEFCVKRCSARVSPDLACGAAPAQT